MQNTIKRHKPWTLFATRNADGGALRPTKITPNFPNTWSAAVTPKATFV